MKGVRLLLAVACVLGWSRSASAQIFSDPFTDTDGVSLQDTAVGGINWDIAADAPCGLKYLSNRLYNDTNFCYAHLFTSNLTPPTADYKVDCPVHIFTHNLEQYAGCQLRLQGGNNTWYGWTYDTLAGVLIIEEVTAGGGATLGSFSWSPVNGTDYTLTIQALGTVLTAYIDGVQRISVIDPSITAAGTPSIANYSPAAATSVTQVHFNSFTVTTVSATATNVPPIGSLSLLGVGK